MIIAFDVDGVLAQTVEAINRFHNDTYGTSFRLEDYRHSDFYKTWGGAKEEEIQKLEEFCSSPYFDQIVAGAGARKGVAMMSKHNTLVVLTSRPNYVSKQKTIEWININFPGAFSQICFTYNDTISNKSRKKSEICCEVGVSVLIEDSLENALDCAYMGTKVLLLDCPWNQQQSLPNGITRVYSWTQIVKYIKQNY